MTDQSVQSFIDCLKSYEKTGNLEPLLDRFTTDGEACNVRMDHPAKGRKGLQSFWTSYRQAFREIESNFTAVKKGGNIAVLEWQSTGSLPSNAPVRYRGVTILEVDADGDHVRSMRSYFDSAGLHPVLHEWHAGHADHRDSVVRDTNESETVAPVSS
jgi:hypothetical protein